MSKAEAAAMTKSAYMTEEEDEEQPTTASQPINHNQGQDREVRLDKYLIYLIYKR